MTSLKTAARYARYLASALSSVALGVQIPTLN
jgi:hypothetical protein